MEKKYQVFISSTFQDLQNARQEVSQALLRADCFPAGMELFPAADAEQFEFIKSVIDQSDYYIIISAGRYGTIHPVTGLSYTEMEYDYAVETGKPVIRLLHRNPKSIADEGDEKLVKLLTFQKKMKSGNLAAFWETPDQLGKEATFALIEAKKTRKAIGWVKADGRASEEAELEIFKLKEKLAEAKSENQTLSLSDRLNYELPVTEAMVIATGANQESSVADYLDELLLEVEHFVDEERGRQKSEMVAFLTYEKMSARYAEQLLDALILDRVLSIMTSSRISISPSGRALLAKARLSKTIGV